MTNKTECDKWLDTLTDAQLDDRSPRSLANEAWKNGAFMAYNQAIEDAKAAIRGENVDDPYAAATFINALARKCSPHVYVNRLSPASAAPVVDKARYEKAHDARYLMSHPVHPDIVVLWFLALKSHWLDNPDNLFYGMREQAKAYLYKWVETGELAEDNTTLEIEVARKFSEWLELSWVPAAATAAPVEQSDER